MEESNKKILTYSFVAAAILTSFVLAIILEILAAMFGPVARLMDNTVIRVGTPVVVGIALFSVMRFNSKIMLWADEVVVEIKKIVWPSKKDTTAMTIVVTVMLLLSGIILGVFDWGSGTFIQWLLKF